MNDFEKVNNIIARSGNNFHIKVLNHLKRSGWHVLISPYYTDNITDKPREIDLIAEKEFPHRDFINKEYGTLNIKLFIECKYINKTNVFWFHDKDRHKAERLLVRSTPFTENNTLKNDHHYLKHGQKVAKLFASENNETIYKALNQSLNALVYNRWDRSIIPPDRNRKPSILKSVIYPIIVFNNFANFYRVDIDSNSDPTKIDDNFQMEINYAYLDSEKNTKNKYFLIDFINFEKIDEFLEIIESEVEPMKLML